jgi:hypothetical protein
MQIIQLVVGFLFAMSIVARADSFVLVASGVSSNATVTVTNGVPVTGFLESLTITAASAVTGTVTVAGRDETIFIVATPAAGGTTTYRPRVTTCWTNGVSYGVFTNVSRVYLAEERPTVAGAGGAITPSASGSVTVTFKLSPQ